MLRPLSRVLSLSTLLLAACVTSGPDETSTQREAAALGEAAAPASEADDAEDLARQIDAKERQLEIARAKLDIAKLELASQLEEQAVGLRHAEVALEMAKEKLARHQEADAPRRLASEQLDLQGAKDRAQEAADELKQIEIMYDEQDLDDLTAEFVVSRGRRNAERAEARIAIQEAAYRTLVERELPAEEASLALEVDKAKAALAAKQRAGEIAQRNREVALQEAENRVVELQAELAALREKVAR